MISSVIVIWSHLLKKFVIKNFIFRPWHVNELLAFDIKNLLLLEKLQFYVCGFSKFLEQETRNQQKSPTTVIASQISESQIMKLPLLNKESSSIIKFSLVILNKSTKTNKIWSQPKRLYVCWQQILKTSRISNICQEVQ